MRLFILVATLETAQDDFNNFVNIEKELEKVERQQSNGKSFSVENDVKNIEKRLLNLLEMSIRINMVNLIV